MLLAISTLFPTESAPHHGVFVRNRLHAMATLLGQDIVVINPIPDSPIHRMMPSTKRRLNGPSYREDGPLKIYHTRYFSLPGVARTMEAKSAQHAVLPLVHNLIACGHQFEHVDIHWTFPDLPVGTAIAKAIGATSTVTLRGMEAFYHQDGKSRMAKIAEGLNHVDRIISLSNEMLSYARNISNVPAAVIRNGVDTTRFSYLHRNSALKALQSAGYAVHENDRILLGVGALIARKGFHQVIEALKRFQQPGFRLVIAGSAGLEGNFEKKLREKAAELPDGMVLFVGNQPNDQLRLWYNVADTFILSSHGEGSPNVLSEALSCGCRAIANNVGSVPDILSSEEGLGVLLPSPSGSDNTTIVHRLETAIQWALSNKESSDVREARSKAMEQYDWEWCAKQSIDCIKSIMSDRREGITSAL